jgi:hypothetical protein
VLPEHGLLWYYHARRLRDILALCSGFFSADLAKTSLCPARTPLVTYSSFRPFSTTPLIACRRRMIPTVLHMRGESRVPLPVARTIAFIGGAVLPAIPLP